MRRPRGVKTAHLPSRFRSLDSSGFTLIELVVVVLLIGIVSAIAMRQLGQTRVQAYQAAMRADLRNFAVAEESYFYDNGVYASSPAAVSSGGFLLTPGVSLVVNEATSVGWSATSGHLRTDVKCYLFVESAAPVGSATEAGKLDCS